MSSSACRFVTDIHDVPRAVEVVRQRLGLTTRWNPSPASRPLGLLLVMPMGARRGS